MKLSELTDNDVIHIRTKKEARLITNLLHKKGFEWGAKISFKRQSLVDYPTNEGNNFYIKKFHDKSISICEPEGKNIIPASRFLKSTPTKKELQAALSIVGEELAFLREEVKMIKKNSELKEFNANIECDFENVKEGLPEKFCIHFRNLDNRQRDFVESHINNSENNSFLNTDFSYYHFKNNTTVDNGREAVYTGYELITFEQFKKYVLKDEDQPKEIDWSKAGQLVESEYNVILTDDQNTKLDISDFSGVIVATKEGSVYYVGHKSNRWLKKDFTIRAEPITLTN